MAGAATATAVWMIEATKNDSTDLVQAAVAYAIHEHLDEGSSQWQTVKRTGFDTTEDVAAKANELWEQAKNKIVKSANWEKVRYTKGMAQGVATAELLDENGHYIGGVPYTVEYDDKRVKVDNPSGVTSSDGPVAINWITISNGEARNFHVKYDVQTLAKLIPRTGQHKIKSGDPGSKSTDDVEFKVVRGMQPHVTSNTSAAIDQSKTVTGANSMVRIHNRHRRDLHTRPLPSTILRRHAPPPASGRKIRKGAMPRFPPPSPRDRILEGYDGYDTTAHRPGI